MYRNYVCVPAAAVMAVATAACDSGIVQGEAAQAAPRVPAEALRAAVSDKQARAFYESRQWQPAWNDADAETLRKALSEAPRHGLSAADYLKEDRQQTNPAAREAGLTLAALRYADALANGRIDPAEIAKPYTLPRPKVDVAPGLAQALAQGELGDWLNALPPQDAEYRALSDAFVRYSELARKEKRQSIPAGKALEPGGTDARVPLIAAALRADGYLAETPAPEGAPEDRYTPQISGAVKQLQEDYGLKADGIVGKTTLDALNGGAAERARTLAINLERRRWLARNPAPTRIDVNTAAAMLSYMRDGREKDRRRVVVGQPGRETPQLGSPIVRLVANPPWNVPESIEKEELASKGSAYLARNNFSWKNGRLVQASGPKSSLGLVKFDMDNPYAIYLHDTPAKALFQADDRHASHGCVRVEDAIGFARMLADDEGVRAAFDRALASGKEADVALPKPIPVRLLYHTAYVEDGRVRFRPDVYGWDEDIAERLGMEKRARQKAAIHLPLSGP